MSVPALVRKFFANGLKLPLIAILLLSCTGGKGGKEDRVHESGRDSNRRGNGSAVPVENTVCGTCECTVGSSPVGDAADDGTSCICGYCGTDFLGAGEENDELWDEVQGEVP